MAEFKRFRTSVGGFNRQDVADYIEQASHAHREQLKLREAELSALRKENAELGRQRDELAAKIQRLHELFGELEETFREIDAEEET